MFPPQKMFLLNNFSPKQFLSSNLFVFQWKKHSSMKKPFHIKKKLFLAKTKTKNLTTKLFSHWIFFQYFFSFSPKKKEKKYLFSPKICLPNYFKQLFFFSNKRFSTTKLYMWQNLTQIVTELRNSNCDDSKI